MFFVPERVVAAPLVPGSDGPSGAPRAKDRTVDADPGEAPRYGRPAKGSRYFGRRPFRLRGPEETLYPLGQQCDA